MIVHNLISRKKMAELKENKRKARRITYLLAENDFSPETITFYRELLSLYTRGQK